MPHGNPNVISLSAQNLQSFVDIIKIMVLPDISFSNRLIISEVHSLFTVEETFGTPCVDENLQLCDM